VEPAAAGAGVGVQKLEAERHNCMIFPNESQ
jgi:hypothetical protein